MVAPFGFAVTFLDLDDAAAAAVTGEVDMATAPEMHRVLLDALDIGRADLVVDMSACAFMDCVGWGVWVGVADTAGTLGGGVTLRHPGPWMCRVRQLLGLEGVLPTEEIQIPVLAT